MYNYINQTRVNGMPPRNDATWTNRTSTVDVLSTTGAGKPIYANRFTNFVGDELDAALSHLEIAHKIIFKHEQHNYDGKFAHLLEQMESTLSDAFRKYEELESDALDLHDHELMTAEQLREHIRDVKGEEEYETLREKGLCS